MVNRNNSLQSFGSPENQKNYGTKLPMVADDLGTTTNGMDFPFQLHPVSENHAPLTPRITLETSSLDISEERAKIGRFKEDHLNGDLE
jgi:hypothetical protein